MTSTAAPSDLATEIYKRLGDDFRSLNVILWQLPPIMITITGGLWFAAANFKLTSSGQSLILMFVSISNVLMILAMLRLRYVIFGLQKQIRAIDNLPTSQNPFLTVSLMSGVLALSAIGSFWVAACPGHYLKAETPPQGVSLSVGTESR